uniref:Uncharacterized protein n=1 Tax=Cacopsylla melanoneura TaxID=428564 RepID=A0A8D8ZDS4_9HEMI
MWNHFLNPGPVSLVSETQVPTCTMNNMSQNERIVYFCGTNDIESRNWSLVFESIEHIVNKYENHRYCFILVPLRLDRPHLNSAIQKFNKKLKALLLSHDIPYLDPS